MSAPVPMPFAVQPLPIETCRLVVDPPRAGSLNMAIDELLLNEAIENRTATLRFYQWAEPTLSLGYFQSHEDRHYHQASADCPIVRRTTGGGAILHDKELTYSFATPVASASRLNHSDLVNAFHQAASSVLQDAGVTARPLCCDEVPVSQEKTSEPFLCFQRRERGDVVTTGEAAIDPSTSPNSKLVGSAQRRRQGALLQHGSLLLEQSAQAPELAGCLEHGGKQIDVQSLIVSWCSLLESKLGISLQSAELTSEELAKAGRIAAEKFASPGWLERR